MLNGQKLQGPQTSAEVYKILQKQNMVTKWVGAHKHINFMLEELCPVWIINTVYSNK